MLIAINCIAQADGLVAVASCALGGGADDEGVYSIIDSYHALRSNISVDDSTMNRPYNNMGSLKVMSNHNGKKASYSHVKLLLTYLLY